MGDVVPFPEGPLHARRAMERIKALWRDGVVRWTIHAEKAMKDDGLETTDIEHIIRYGRVVEHSHPGSLWRYKVEGATVEGGRAACIVEIDGQLIIITVFLL